MLQRQTLSYTILSIGMDAIALVISLALADYVRNHIEIGRSFGWEQFLPIPVYGIALIAWLLSFSFFSIYNPQNIYRITQEIRRVILSTVILLFMLAGMLYFSYRDISRLLVIYFFMIYLISVIGWRILFNVLGYSMAHNKHFLRRVVVIGEEDRIQQVIETIQLYSWADIQLVGIITDSPTPSQYPVPILGTLTNAKTLISEHHVDELILALPSHAYRRLSELVYDLQKLPIRIHIIPDYLNLALYRARVEDFGGLPLIQLRAPALTAEQRLMKRIFDLCMGTLLLILALPMMGIIALFIRYNSSGGILFRQERVGENGVIFGMFKFRTMVTDADKAQPIWQNEDGTTSHKVPYDPRITSVGRFLRQTSLDELPQLFNVLRGEMSLVGPRPEMPWLVDQYAPWQRTRFAVPQGITGWWQINNRHSQPMAQHTEDDLYYIQNYSIWFDLWIIVRTIGVVISRQGAY